MAISVNIPVKNVFEKWSDAMKVVVGENNVAMSSSTNIATAPFCKMFMMGSPTYRRDVEGNEVAVTLTFQTEVFSSGNKALEKVYGYDQKSHEVMIGMGFQRIFGAELVDNADDDIKRLVSRYSMTYTNAGLLN